VRPNKHPHLASGDCDGQIEQSMALEVQSATNLFDIFDIRQSTRRAKFFQNPALVA